MSIIVPSFNQGKFIRRTLQSILEQDYRPIEVLVIDGASTDETVAILHKFDDVAEVSWVSEPDTGVVEAVNKGFARAQGEIGAIQSSDDFYLPGAISAAVSALSAEEGLAFVFGDVAKVDSEGRPLSRTNLAEWTLEGLLSLETWIPQPSTFFRMSMAKALGGWRSHAPFAADTELWLRMSFQGRARKLDRLMAERSMHDAQRDTQGAKIIRDYGRMLDSLEDLAGASRRLRRAAFAGRMLLANRYSAADGPFTKLLRLWRAALAYPPLFRRMPVTSFIPGYFSARALLSGIRARHPL